MALCTYTFPCGNKYHYGAGRGTRTLGCGGLWLVIQLSSALVPPRNNAFAMQRGEILFLVLQLLSPDTLGKVHNYMYLYMLMLYVHIYHVPALTILSTMQI